MGKYKLLRERFDHTATYSNLSSGNVFTDSEMEGTATLHFFYDPNESTNGLDGIPLFNETLKDVDYYCSGSTTTEYENLRVNEITKEIHNVDGTDNNIYKINYGSATTNTGNQRITNFQSGLEVVTVGNPISWYYGTSATPASDAVPPTDVSGKFSPLQQNISRIITTGSFTARIPVTEDNMETFWGDYLAIAGKLNSDELSILGPTSLDGIYFKRGQVLGSSISDGGTLGTLRYFDVTVQFRLIGDTDFQGGAIVRDDWQYVLSPVGDGSVAGWAIAWKSDGNGGSTVNATNPFPYPYADASAFYDLLIGNDYTTP